MMGGGDRTAEINYLINGHALALKFELIGCSFVVGVLELQSEDMCRRRRGVWWGEIKSVF